MDTYQDNLCFLGFETTGVNVFIDESIQIGEERELSAKKKERND